MVEGFLHLAAGYGLEVVWCSAEGVEKARGQVEDDYLPLTRSGQPGLGPAGGDRLELFQRRRATEAGPGWEVRTILVVL
jgi:orotidine-5'-phosphate decarboxylase